MHIHICSVSKFLKSLQGVIAVKHILASQYKKKLWQKLDRSPVLLVKCSKTTHWSVVLSIVTVAAFCVLSLFELSICLSGGFK